MRCRTCVRRWNVWLAPADLYSMLRSDTQLYLEEYPATQHCQQDVLRRYAWFHDAARTAQVLQHCLQGELAEGGATFYQYLHVRLVAARFSRTCVTAVSTIVTAVYCWCR